MTTVTSRKSFLSFTLLVIVGNWVISKTLANEQQVTQPFSLKHEWNITRLNGRRFERNAWGLELQASRAMQLWYGEEQFFALGRDRSNRFELGSLNYGVRFHTGWQGVFAEYQAHRPRNAHATSPSSEAIYNATQLDKISLERNPLKLSLAWVKGSERSASSLGLSWSQGGSFGARATWQIISGLQIDFPSRAVGSTSSSHPFLQGVLKLPFVWGLALETELEFWPSGLSYASSSLSPLSSFLIYEPGGVVRDLQRKPFGWVVFRIVFNPK